MKAKMKKKKKIIRDKVGRTNKRNSVKKNKKKNVALITGTQDGVQRTN